MYVCIHNWLCNQYAIRAQIRPRKWFYAQGKLNLLLVLTHSLLTRLLDFSMHTVSFLKSFIISYSKIILHSVFQLQMTEPKVQSKDSVHEGKKPLQIWHLLLYIFIRTQFEDTFVLSSWRKKAIQMWHLLLCLCKFGVTCGFCSRRKEARKIFVVIKWNWKWAVCKLPWIIF